MSFEIGVGNLDIDENTAAGTRNQMRTAKTQEKKIEPPLNLDSALEVPDERKSFEANGVFGTI